MLEYQQSAHLQQLHSKIHKPFFFRALELNIAFKNGRGGDLTGCVLGVCPS